MTAPRLQPSIEHLRYQILHKRMDGWGMVTHLRVWRHDKQDGITWDELQAVKDEALGELATCIEVYPAAPELVNEINCRHLWEVPLGVPLPTLRRV